MRSHGITLLVIFISITCCFFCKGQVPVTGKDTITRAVVDTAVKMIDCRENSSSILLNSFKEKNDWQIISGPPITGIQYPVQSNYTKPFPSWEMDRYTADSSYFRNCDWMVLPDKRTVINTNTRVPVVFIKRFTTVAPSKLKLIVKMLYDNMAYLYIDSTWIKLNHRNGDVNRFIKKLRPELSGFVSIPATFNYSFNASFYAGDFYNLVLPKGDHVIRIELFNNAYELGCIIKGILISEDDEKIFCGAPVKEEQAELESILIFRDEKAFPKNDIADTLYGELMQSVKKGCWINNLVRENLDLVSHDTLFVKKGEKINMTPAYVTEFYNGEKDTVYAVGSLKKIGSPKAVSKKWERSFVFDALTRGNYQLEINCETPADARHKTPGLINKYSRVVCVK
ncbi:MAG: hypothetical protein ABIQ31_15115 [Ferruginibacter sp.]